MKIEYYKEKVKPYMSGMPYFLLSAVINFVIESASRHSIKEGWSYLTDTPLTFIYNTLVIWICYLTVYLVRRKVFACAAVSALWLFAGISNGVVLTNRVTPLTGFCNDQGLPYHHRALYDDTGDSYFIDSDDTGNRMPGVPLQKKP